MAIGVPRFFWTAWRSIVMIVLMKTKHGGTTDWLNPIRDEIRLELESSTWAATAARLGVAVNTLQNLLNGSRAPVASTIGRLMEIYGFTLEKI